MKNWRDVPNFDYSREIVLHLARPMYFWHLGIVLRNDSVDFIT